MKKNTDVKFVDLAVPTRQIRKAYLARVDKLLGRANFILTREVEDFEKAWAHAVGARYAVGVSNGSDALYLGLRALGIRGGDEVITQGNAYNASVTAIMRVGARPRFADINGETWQMDVRAAEKLITKKTKAIMPVHLFGQPNDMAAIAALAKRKRIRVIEDCAQSHLAAFKGRMTGAWGDIGAFSFYPTKNLGAFGDAGAVTTNDPKLYRKLKILRNLGQDGKDNHVEYACNMRLDAMQAIALRLKLKFLARATQKRMVAGARYDRMIHEARIPVRPQARHPRADHVYHLYPVYSTDMSRDEIRRKLGKQGIPTGVYYPLPVYRQPFFRGPHDPCPVTDKIVSGIFSLPMYVGITVQDQRRVVAALKRIFQNSF